MAALPSDRREFSRVSVSLPAMLRLADGRFTLGRVHDLCVRGALFTGNLDIARGTTCELVINPNQAAEGISIRAQACVERCTPWGTGVEFVTLDVESFEHLKDLIRLHAEDVVKVEREFEAHVGLRKREDG